MTKTKQIIIKQTETLAWKTLIKHNITKLPVDLFEILSKERIPLYSFTIFEEISTKYHLIKPPSNDGFAVKSRQKTAIFINPTIISPQRIRFTIAHELGHILLGHLNMDTCTQNDDEKEWQANVFASRLLAPPCVLHEMCVTDSQSISRICDISQTAATHKVKQILSLDRINKEYTQSLEERLLCQFHYFIESYNSGDVSIMGNK